VERENLYYPIRNPENDCWYPCDENRVWAYATEARVKDKQLLQAETMEEFIRRNQILFPTNDLVVTWNSLEEIYKAIDSGNIPVTPKRKRPLLSRDTPNLEFWVGKKVGFGRPLFKKFWKDLQSHTNPLGSWISRVNEIYDDEEYISITSPNAGEGTELIQEIFGRKAFQYPKPPALIKNLLSQASNGNDTILDFFAGSGTTGHVVLALNKEDGGNRNFILCSSTEATSSSPEKNLCRDVCAERIKRVIQGYAKTPGLGGDFAYVKVLKKQEQDILYMTDPLSNYAFNVVSMRETGGISKSSESKIKVVTSDKNLAVIICEEVSQEVINQLRTWPSEKLSIYSSRSKSIIEGMAGSGKIVNTYSLMDVAVSGFVAGSDINE
jgi:adenine-specific DNA-methyltransferase